MQSSDRQKYKSDLINWINQLEDIAVLQELKTIMQAVQSGHDFTLTDEQIFTVEEGAAKYESGEEQGYTWQEVQHNTITSFYNLTEEEIADIKERDRKYLSGEETASSWEEVKKRILAKLDEKKA